MRPLLPSGPLGDAMQLVRINGELRVLGKNSAMELMLKKAEKQPERKKRHEASD